MNGPYSVRFFTFNSNVTYSLLLFSSTEGDTFSIMRGQNVVKSLGASVRNRRFQLGISQEELANRADLHRTYIAGVEGGNRNITLKSIQKLASALEVSIPELLSAPDAHTPHAVHNGHQTVEILLAETKAEDVTLTLRVFREANITNPVHVVTDGAQALEFLFGTGAHSGRKGQNPPRLLLLNLNLPKIDGIEVLRRIKADPRAKCISVVLLAGAKEKRQVAASRKFGVAACLTKPLDFKTFARIAAELQLKWALMESRK